MKLNRQQILLAAFALIGLFQAGEWVLATMIEGPKQTRQATTNRLQKEIKKQTNTLARMRKAGTQLAEWQQRSLPGNIGVARQVYRSWLLELVETAKLQSPNVDSATPVKRRGGYVALQFTVRGHGTLKQITRFLYEFSSAGYLHRIQTMGLTPIGSTGQVDLSLSIEALSLPGAATTGELSTEPGERLAFASLSDYAPIAQRNVFGLASDALDPIASTFVTAVIVSNGQPRVWITRRTDDKVFKLGVGDQFEAGDLQGRVAAIVGQDVVLEIDGERWLIEIGENLAEAFALPPELSASGN